LNPISDELKCAAEILAQSHAAVALTGAGLSTRSGIPDFRSPGTGLWERMGEPPPNSLQRFAQAPELFYAWLAPLLRTILTADPNPAHYALAEWEANGRLTTIVTQNVDRLHQRSGSANVIEIHGTLERATCFHCYCSAPGLPLLEKYLADGEVPRCDECGGVMKPNVILMGEQLPYQAVQAARAAIRACDLLLIAGTSLAVKPVADLPALALQRDAHIILVDQMPTPLDDLADIVIHADVVEALPALFSELRRGRSP
jgi:NAD-dependent deacetylase